MFYSQLGYYVTGIVWQIKLKEEAKERILLGAPDSLLETIVLSGQEKYIEWEEKGKEFSFRGRMYDLVRVKTVNGKTILFCSNDDNETALLDQINDITKANHQNTGKNNIPPVIKLVYDAVVQHSSQQLLFPPSNDLADIYFTVALSQQTRAVVAPPPRA